LLKKFLGIGIAGKLQSNINHYKKTNYVFDYKNIICNFTSWNFGIYTISANCICSDPYAGGLSNSAYVSFYSKQFKSKIKAISFLDKEIHYLVQEFPSVNVKRIIPKDNDNKDTITETYLDGRWVILEENNYPYICTECHCKNYNAICSQCGGICQSNI